MVGGSRGIYTAAEMVRNMNFRILYNVRSDRISDRLAGIYLFSRTIVFGTETARVLRFRRVDTPPSCNRLYNITGGRLCVRLIFGGGFRFTIFFISLASTNVIFQLSFRLISFVCTLVFYVVNLSIVLTLGEHIRDQPMTTCCRRVIVRFWTAIDRRRLSSNVKFLSAHDVTYGTAAYSSIYIRQALG